MTDVERLFDGYGEHEVALLERHAAEREPEAGFVKDFVGTRMDIRFANFTQNLGGVCFGLPIPGDYRAEAIEYIGTIKAVEGGVGRFVAAELGAGWGPWIVTAGHLARKLGRGPIKLYGVEANAGKVDSMRQHLANNGFDPDQQAVIQAVAGPTDGAALFPIVDAIGNWGGEAIFTETLEERPGYSTVPSITIATLLKEEQVVDLIHFDIQGAEAEVIPQSLATLNEKVRFLVVGTHSRSIEGKLIDLLMGNGWVLENEQPCRCSYSDGRSNVLVDGTQVWRNPDIAPHMA